MAWTKIVARKYQRAWYLGHRQQHLARTHRRFVLNRESILAHSRNCYRLSRGGKVKKYGLKNLCGHPEERHFCRRKCKSCFDRWWYRRNREAERKRSLRWATLNPEKEKARSHRRRVSLKGKGSFTSEEWLALLRFYRWRCYYCSKRLTRKSASPDHKTPLVRDGSNRIRNIVPSCRYCNYSKNCKSPAEFLRRQQRGKKEVS